METRAEVLKKMGVSSEDAQVLHQSDCVRSDAENLDYSAKALRSEFGKYFQIDEETVD